MKFRSKRQCAEGLGHLLAEIARDWPIDADYIVPIPLHPAKKRVRGFNQAAVLAQPLSKALGIPIAEDILKRVRKTAAQSGLSPVSREQNISGAFALGRKDSTDRKILLVDDIFTSGATMNACAKILQNAAEVSCISLSIAAKDFIKFEN